MTFKRDNRAGDKAKGRQRKSQDPRGGDPGFELCCLVDRNRFLFVQPVRLIVPVGAERPKGRFDGA